VDLYITPPYVFIQGQLYLIYIYIYIYIYIVFHNQSAMVWEVIQVVMSLKNVNMTLFLF
jgi:hypothetical protein